jgi:hypothetical protein
VEVAVMLIGFAVVMTGILGVSRESELGKLVLS